MGMLGGLDPEQGREKTRVDSHPVSIGSREHTMAREFSFKEGTVNSVERRAMDKPVTDSSVP